MRAFLFFWIFALGCGKDVVVEKPVPQEPPPVVKPPPGEGPQISYPKMQGLLNQYCLKCHQTAGFMQNESALRASTSRARILNRSMPPSSSNIVVPETKRTEMINFF